MSNLNKPIADFYVVGGTVHPDSPSYIERAADRELYERTLAGDFCYVLTSRQVGKSSLMARTAARLKKEGIRNVIVDLTQIGTEQEKQSADRWYYGIAYRVVKDLGIDVNLAKWWQEGEKLPALQRLTEFFGDVVLAGGEGPVVIFVDEIDTTIGLEFSDDFFAAVRACYNARATQPKYRRLSFVLLGVATPSQLIKDMHRTPFNIGYPIELTDFTFAEAQPLAQCLVADQSQGEETLKRILYWSGGHPYLTQRLCRLAAGEKPMVYGNEAIDRLVEKNFLAFEAQRSDSNINFVRDRMLQKKKYRRKLLTLYRRIVKGDVIEDQPLSIAHSFLKLSGVVVPAEKRELRVRNRIYQGIFTKDWVKEVMPVNWARDITAASIVLLILAFTMGYLWLLPRIFMENIRGAVEDTPVASYNKLKNISGFAGKADELLADYWDRRTLHAEFFDENRDEGLLCRLQALTVKDTATRRSENGRLLAGDYKNLMATYRHNAEAGVITVAFSPDGKTVLTGSANGTTRLWRADNGQPLAEPIGHGPNVTTVAFSPDGKTVLTGSGDGTAQLWHSDNEQSLTIPMKPRDMVLAVAFSPDGKTVLTGSNDGTARLWRADNGQPLAEPMKHEGNVHTVAFSPDGKTVLTGSADGTARLWRADNGQPLGKPLKHRGNVIAVSFSPDGKTVLTGSTDSTARLWRADNGQPLSEPMKHGDFVQAVAFSPDGKTVWTGSYDGTVRLWRAGDGQPLTEPINYIAPILALAFSPDGKTVLIGSLDGTARLCRADNVQPLAKPINYIASARVMAISPDGKTVLTGSLDGIARLCRADNGQPLAEPMKHGDFVHALAFSPDGKTVLTASDDGTVRLWRADNGQPLAEPMKHDSHFTAVAFSPDGKTVLTGSYDGMVRLWRADNGQPLLEPIKHGPYVTAVAFSPDGKTLLTGSDDGTARLWRADNGRSLAEPIKHSNSVHAVAFSPDGKAIMTCTYCWIHRSIVDGNKVLPQSSRLLPGFYPIAFHFLDEQGDKLQVAVHVARDSINIITMCFDNPDAPSIQGDPKELLAEWQRKLALKLNEDGKIEPMYSIEASKRRLEGEMVREKEGEKKKEEQKKRKK